jgi:predicted SAM-dependent methyltransferase
MVEKNIHGNLIKRIRKRIFGYIKFELTDLYLKMAAKRQHLKIIVGAGGVSRKGWLGTEICHLNLLDELTWARYFKESSIQAILAEHVWEHLTEYEAEVAVKLCFKYLKEGGYIRIAVPDGFQPSEQYIDAVKPGGSGPGSDDHKILYNHTTITELIRSAGFKVKLLEWYDCDGEFNFVDWQPDTGMVRRSSRYDPRNSDSELNYTSLIVDAIKPF